MLKYITETEAVYDNHKYIVNFFENGTYTAYVKLNEDEKDLFEKIKENLDQFKILVPNGAIFTNESQGMWVGFGTNTLFDLPDISKVINTFVLSQESKMRLIDSFKTRLSIDCNATIKSSKYMVNGCMDLIDRLKLIK